MSDFEWRPLAEMWSCKKAEHAKRGAFELIAWDASNLAEERPMGQMPVYGWELFTGPKYQDQVATGSADTYEAARAAVEAAWQQRRIDDEVSP